MHRSETSTSTSSAAVEILDPIKISDWDQRVFAHPEATIFHSSIWASVLHEAFGYQPLYFSVTHGNELAACLPVMEVNSPIFGRRGKTLPFTDYCNFLGDPETAYGLIDDAVDYGRQRQWKSLEVRAGKGVTEHLPCQRTCYAHRIDLRNGADEAFANFRDNTRRNIRRAKKSGVKVQHLDTRQAMRQYRRLHCMTRKRQGHFTQPAILFKKIYEKIIAPGHGFVSIATIGKQPIAGAIYFHANGHAFFAYGASDKSYQHLRPNNLVMWEAIKNYAEQNFNELNLGVTDGNNAGLRRYKNGMASCEEIVHYYKYNYEQAEFVNHSSSSLNNWRFKVARKLPSPMLTALGSLLYKHHG